MDVRGAVCLVTGAASGIGAAIVADLDRRGALAVIALDRQPAVRNPPLLHGTDYIPIQADVSNVAEMQSAFDAARSVAEGLDLVFNNAGVIGRQWPDQAVEEVAALAAINLGGAMIGTRLAIDAMTGRGGVVINTASKTGLIPDPESAAYAATKAGVIHFTRCCAALAATHRVRVNAVLPGLTDTQMLASRGRPAAVGAPAGRRLLTAAEVARVIVSVAEDDSTEPGTYQLADLDAINTLSNPRPGS